MNFKKYIPILEWLPKYSLDIFKGDLTAGLTVGIIMIPQGIAYALIAGIPPIYGLYTALVPQLVYAIFGSSRQVSTGPVAMDSLIVAAGVSTIAVVGTENYLAITILIALLTGAVQFLMGVFKMGFIVNFLSKPVITGFTSAAALIIGFNQFKNLLGIDVQRSNQFHKLTFDIWTELDSINWYAFLIGGIAILIIKFLKKVNKRIPSAILVVIIGILIMKFGASYFSTVEIVGDIPKGLPTFSVPDLKLDMLGELLPIAFTLAMIGFLEMISIGKSLECKQNEYRIYPNQELIALGLGNMLGSLFNSYPSTASFSRSAVNQEMGARTGVAALISAGVVLITLLFLTPLFYYLPKTVLAAIIIVAVFNLIKVSEFKHLWKSDKIDFVMLIVTFLMTLFVGIKEGIGVGVTLSLLVVIYRSSRPHMAILGQVENTQFYRNIHRFKNLKVDPRILIVRFDAELYFANTTYFKEKLKKMVREKGDQLEVIILNAETISAVDSSAIEMLGESVKFYAAKNIKLYFTNLKGPVRDALHRSGILDVIGKENCFLSIHNAVEYFGKKNSDYHEKYDIYLNQSNT
ncbi:SulP family inorganic anion transporter [Aureivirga sp. CE67]|uniref:SulP family inorganic anion transporter n=1 Tax=Aureivirga sp. CE67 TaxID=1788983 RepID=UPI0018CA4983|nr:solute carrier family 26 protein [Aureivirga sp. CE67]